MIPFEIITGLLSTGIAGWLNMKASQVKNEQIKNELMLARSGAQMKALQQARAMKAPGLSFTKRTLALMVMTSVFIIPMVAPLFFPDVTVTTGYTEFKPGFLFFSDGREVIKWVTNTGLTLNPFYTNMAAMIIGYYFGASITRRV